MQKSKADEIVQIFRAAGIACERVTRPGHRRVWAVSITLEAEKREEFENILLKHDLKIKAEYEPDGISKERVYLY